MTTIPDPAEEAAWQLFNAGDVVGAGGAFEQILKSSSDSVGALQGRVASLRKQRRYERAQEALDSALALQPAQPGILAERAWLQLDRKQYSKAIDSFDAVLQTGHAAEGIHLWKVSLLRGERRFREAQAALVAAQCEFPGSLRLDIESAWLKFHQKLYDDAIIAFCTVLEIDPTEASAWQGKIAAQRKLERFSEAEQSAATALQQCPHAPGILTEKGWIAFDRELYESAEAAFNAAVALAPNDPQIKVCLALALTRQENEDDREAAAQACRAALALDPHLAEAHGCLGIIAFKRGRLGESEWHLKASTEVDPLFGRFTDLGSLYIQMGRPVDAEKCFRTAINNDPDDVFAHIQLGSLLLQKEKPKQALNEFRQAVALSPTNPEAYRALAVGLTELGRFSEGEMTLRSAIKLLDASKRSGLHLALCQLLTRIGDGGGDIRHYEEALKEAGSALALRPNYATAHFFRGVVKFKLGDNAGALTCFQQTLEFDKEHMQAGLNRERVRALVQQERKLTRTSELASAGLLLMLFVQLVAIWWLFIDLRMSGTVFAVLLPLLLGLTVVAILLPALTKLKLTGLEAELSVPKAKDALASGPKGAVGFGNSAPRSI